MLEAGKLVEREADLPPEAYASGELTLTIEKSSGPNAVVSAIEVLSTDPAAVEGRPFAGTGAAGAHAASAGGAAGIGRKVEVFPLGAGRV